MLNILKVPAPELSQVCAPVENFDETWLKECYQNMLETMLYANGIGLAGSQVGVMKRLAVVMLDAKKSVFLINPVLQKYTGHQVNLEGCLSIPQRKVQVLRPRKALIEYSELDGTRKTINLSGIQAACALHEMDHMNGITILQRSALQLALPTP